MVYIIGHRGAPFEEPENTIESFKKAIEFGVDFFECDVHLTKDEKVVVIHDHTLEKTTNGRGYVKDFTLAELKKLTISGSYKIPTLEEVLGLNFPVVIELRAFNPPGELYPSGHPNREIYPKLVEKTVEAIKATKLKNLILVSFDRRYLQELNNYPEFKKMFLSRPFPDLDEIEKLNLFGLGIEYHNLDQKNVRLAHKQGLKVFAWTVNREDDIREVIDLGVDYICSDDPVLVKKIAAEK